MSDDKETAEAHVKWYMGLLRKQMEAWMKITEELLIANFIHGMKHGRESYFCSEDKYKDYLKYIAKKQEEALGQDDLPLDEIYR